MVKLKIEACAILNEEKPEFFAELISKGVDAVEPEMKKQIDKLNKLKSENKPLNNHKLIWDEGKKVISCS